MNKNGSHLTIVGGGPAGLGIAFYARYADIGLDLYEANGKIGGNASTTTLKGFSWDSGAHRFHDRFADITTDMKLLMGEELKKVTAPSHIIYMGSVLQFPLQPLSILKLVGLGKVLKALGEVIIRKSLPAQCNNLEDYAIGRYGKTLARPFLLDYSEKLWGIPASQLSKQVAGKRLQGIKLKDLIFDSLGIKRSNRENMEGDFYYPSGGIGALMDAISSEIGYNNIHLNSRIEAIYHENGKITGIQINESVVPVFDRFVNTLPVNLFLKLLRPAPPAYILGLTDNLRYRNLILVVFFLEKDGVSNSASLYFPGKEIFTRITEPRNRSLSMAPESKTSLVAEISCFEEDKIWRMKDEDIKEITQKDLIGTGLVNRAEISEVLVQRLSFAYPIITTSTEKIILAIDNYLSGFANLINTGRNARFTYTHIHDMLKWGKDTVDELRQSATRSK